MGELPGNRRFSQEIVRSSKERGLRVTKADNLHLLDRMNGQIEVVLSLCPLYRPGLLRDSSLLLPPLGIEDSRVAIKWATLSGLINAVNGVTSNMGYNPPRFEVIFADIGVITSVPTGEERKVLDYHYQLYDEALGALMPREQFTLRRYSDLGIEFPELLPSTGSANGDISELMSGLSEELSKAGVKIREGSLNAQGNLSGRAEKIIRKMIAQVGDHNLARSLLIQYGLFDGASTKENALNVFIERESAGLLLQITDVFEHSRYPRLDLIC